MKKHLFYALLACATLTFVACDKSKDKNNPDDPTTSGEISENGVKNEFGEGRLIIGGWDVTRGSYHFVFKSDGTCIQDGYSYESGIWSYNPETKILATTMASWSWSMNIVTAEALQGIYLNKGTSYGFNHYGNYSQVYVDANPKLIIGKWKTKEGKVITFDKNNCTLNDKKYTYAIQGIDPQNYEADVKIIFDGNLEYTLVHLSGGYIRIGKQEETGIFAGQYYYVSE